MIKLQKKEDELLKRIEGTEQGSREYFVLWAELDDVRCDMIESDGIVEEI